MRYNTLPLYLLFFYLTVYNSNAQSFLLHAHNDYAQSKPLENALNLGFHSIEIDIYEDNGKIRVAHDPQNISTQPLIDTLYFDPLFKNKATLDRKVVLLIDIKKYTPTILLHLEELLHPYQSNIQKTDDPSGKEMPFQIILSGDYPKEDLIASKQYPFFFLDGRPSDLGRGISSDIMPWISISFKAVKNKRRLIKQAHDEDKLFRFWATSENDKFWSKLIKWKVDIIGTDDQAKLAEFASDLK